MPKASTLATSSPATVTALRDVLGVDAIDLAQSAGMVAYATLADLPASPADGTAAWVTSDGTAENNGFYRYDQGTTAWVKWGSWVDDAATSAQSASDSADAAAASAAAVYGDIASTAAGKGSGLIGFNDSVAPNYLKTVSDIINGQRVSLHRFIDPTKLSAIRAGTTTYDASEDIQDALDSGVRSLFMPNGTHLISQTVRRNESGSSLALLGENWMYSKLKAIAGMTDPMLWLGLTSASEVQRFVLENFCISGVAGTDYTSVTAGNDGLVLCAGHISSISKLRIEGCDIGIVGPGIEGSTIDKCNIASCNLGIDLFRPTQVATPDPDNYHESNNNLPPNATRIRDNWITGCNQGGIRASAATLLHISDNVFQSATLDRTYSPILLEDCNSSYVYGAGPIVENNWFEGTIGWVAAIRVKTTNMATIRNNLIAGASTSGAANKEGGVIASGSDNLRIYDNSFFYWFNATPTEGRVANGPVYLHSDCANYVCRDNYFVRSQCGDPYFEGEFGPTYTKNTTTAAVSALIQAGGAAGGVAATALVAGDAYTIATAGGTDWTAVGAADNNVGTVFTATGAGSGTGTATRTATCLNGKHVGSVTRNSIGRYTISHVARIGNITAPTSNLSFVTVLGTVVCFAVVQTQADNSTTIRFYDAAGSLVDPDRFTYMRYGTPVAST